MKILNVILRSVLSAIVLVANLGPEKLGSFINGLID